MFVDATRRRNPGLIAAAVELHRRGDVPSNCYVIDIDTVAQNAALVAALARRRGLDLLQMTKQFGRNPLVAQVVAGAGIPQVVAVDFEEARVLHRYGLEIGHLGHLVQVPAHEVLRALDMRPRQITVFSVAQATRIARAAAARGVTQPLLLRIEGEGDVFYPAQRGGIREDELVQAAKAIDVLDGVRVVGVTSFPCLLWNAERQRLEPTPNLSTIGRAAEQLRVAGLEISVVNAPSATCSATLDTLVEHGATQGEPGSCLTGHTPLHAVSDEPERPAMVYVSEVTHRAGNVAYALGGGLYPRSRAARALVFGRGDREAEVGVALDPPEAIDYHGTLLLDGAEVEVGDTVVYAFRSQVFVARSFVAVVTGVDTSPSLLGCFTRDGYPLDKGLVPCASAELPPLPAALARTRS